MAPKEKKATDHSPIWPGGGLDGFISAVSQLIQECGTDDAGTRRFIQRASEDYAFIRLQDIRQPIRFLKQMAGAPPWQFGPSGFHPDVVDDTNPARHYMAFVFLGYWLPRWLAVGVAAILPLAGSLAAGFSFLRLTPALNELYATAINLGWGLPVLVLGSSVLSVGVILRNRERKIL